jgi:ribosomal protein S27AE
MKAKILSLLAIVLVGALILAIGCERKVVNEVQDVILSGATYVGSDACAPAECHASIYTTFSRSGHPFKLNKAADVQAGNYYPDFCSSLPGPPAGYDWPDVTYVIGGYWWKARFTDTAGYIVTGTQVQYNFENNPLDSSAHWTAYHAGEVDKPFDCGRCHTTGFDPLGNQDGLPGMEGSWAFPGIQCEECHGPASLHISNPRGFGMAVDRSPELCGKCHYRDSINVIPASKGFIRHHEQWNEMATTKHRSLDCVDCHDPHLGLHPNNPDRTGAIIMDCESCHFKEAATFATSTAPHAANGVQCIDCHMPYAAKSAVGDTAQHTGDIRSHLVRISTDSTKQQFTTGNFANGYLTLDFTCLQPGICHLGEDDMAWALDSAHVPHNGYAGIAKAKSNDNNKDLMAAH